MFGWFPPPCPGPCVGHRFRYNPKGWVGYGEYRPGISAFLFTWPDGDTTKRAFKLRKVG